MCVSREVEWADELALDENVVLYWVWRDDPWRFRLNGVDLANRKNFHVFSSKYIQKKIKGTTAVPHVSRIRT